MHEVSNIPPSSVDVRGPALPEQSSTTGIRSAGSSVELSPGHDITPVVQPPDSGSQHRNTSRVVMRRHATGESAAEGASHDVEAAGDAAVHARLQNLAPDASPEERNFAILAAHALYGQNIGGVHNDELKSLVGNAEVFMRYDVTTEPELRNFLQKSWGEAATPLLGRLGYEALLPMGLKAGAKIPSPFTGLPIGFTVMSATTITASMRDGLEARHYPALKTSGLPESLQKRFNSYDRDMLPPGLRAELIRQAVRALVTLVPALNAMRTGQPLDLKTIIHRDVIADAVTFHSAENMDSAWNALKTVFTKVFGAADQLKAKGIKAPTHDELLAHQPKEVLEPRLKAYRAGTGHSIVDGIKGMGAGIANLVRNQHGRLGVPLNAALLISVSLCMTEFLISKDPSNKLLPEGKVSPRSALAVPATLMYMEFLATAAFPSLLKAFDAISFKKPPVLMKVGESLEQIHVSEGPEVEMADMSTEPTSTTPKHATEFPAASLS